MKKQKNKTEDAMLNAVAVFVKSVGWNVIVIGGSRIFKKSRLTRSSIMNSSCGLQARQPKDIPANAQPEASR